MKWPMPSEAKFSPAFHEVRPSIVPLHSFCQIRFPMRRVSAGERLIAAAAKEHETKMTIARAVALRGRERAGLLDGENLFNSMPVPAALRMPVPAALAPILLMNRSIICFAAVFAASLGLAQDKPALKDTKDKESYSIGHDIGTTFKKQNIDLNLDALMLGLKDALAGKEAMTKEERDKTLEAFSKEMMEKQVAANKEAAAKNLAAGEKFLAENKKKEGVKTTASGLQYKEIKAGTGAQPKATDTVTVNYRGTLIDGTEFDSSYKRNQPATFPLNAVIKGWTEGLQLMKVGSKYQFFVPPNLAYGERSVGPDIAPNSTLIFEVELMDAKPPAAGASPAAPAPPKANPPTTSAPPKPSPK